MAVGMWEQEWKPFMPMQNECVLFVSTAGLSSDYVKVLKDMEIIFAGYNMFYFFCNFLQNIFGLKFKSTLISTYSKLDFLVCLRPSV